MAQDMGSPGGLISSIDILTQSGLSRATMNNYIKMGILPRPIIKRPDEASNSRAKQLGYFPHSVMDTLRDIARYKKEGRSMEEIRAILSRPTNGATEQMDNGSPLGGEGTENHRPGLSDRIRNEEEGFCEPGAPGGKETRGGRDPERPSLARFAVFAAELQDAEKIRAALPPAEYFSLVRRVWTSTAAFLRKSSGIQGQHGVDERVFYFFKGHDPSYLMNAVIAAIEVRYLLKEISHGTKMKGDIDGDLFMNIGIAQGEEFVGVIAETPAVEWMISQGDTVHTARLLSRMGRFGSIWATKDLLHRLDEKNRQRIRYGICRKGPHRDILLENRFSRVMDLVPQDHPEHNKMTGIMALPVTEIQSLR